MPGPQRTGVTNNILPYYTDYNVMIYSRGRYLPLNDLMYLARFNGYCVHADCRDTLVAQSGFNPVKLGVNDITLHVIDQLYGQFSRCLPYGGMKLPGVPHIYPFLAGYEVDFLTRVFELSNWQTASKFDPKKQNWNELAADTLAQAINGTEQPFPWCGFGEIIYYNPKRKAYQDELSLYAGKTPLTPIPEFIQFSQENPLHPIVQIHYWIGNDEAWQDLVSWASNNPQANIILCHGGYERGDNIRDWLLKMSTLPKNVLVEISWTLLDLIYENRAWIFDHLPGNVHWIYGSDTTPHSVKDGRDPAVEVDRLVQVATMLHSPKFSRPVEGNEYFPNYKVPHGGA